MAERLCVSTNWRGWILMVGGPRFNGLQDEVPQRSRCRSPRPKSKPKCSSNLVSSVFEDCNVTNTPWHHQSTCRRHFLIGPYWTWTPIA